MSIADRILLMEHGKLQQYAAPLDIYRAPANRFVAEFIGTPNINLLPGVYDSASGAVQTDQAKASIRVPARYSWLREGQRVLIGIRPEDCMVADTGTGTLSGEVTYVELAGRDCWIRLNSGGHTIRLIVPNDTVIRQGETIHITFRSSKLHVFDAESGVRLSPGTSREEDRK
jgi:ABC-type sugar transport system ATPase subunit